MDNNEGIKYIEDAAQLERERLTNEYNAGREKAIGEIDVAEQKLIPTYQTAREQTNVASQIGARNLAERWAQRGQTGAGIAAQSEMSRQNVLAREIGSLNKQEGEAKQEFARQRTVTGNDYTSRLESALAALDINTLNAIQAEKTRLEEQTYQRDQDRIANNLAWARVNQDNTTQNQIVNGSVRNVNGQVQQYLDGKWSNVYYAKNDKGEIKNTKTYKWNQQGYGLTDMTSNVSYTENGKTKQYKVWVKDNEPYLIINEAPIYIGQDLTRLEQSLTTAYNSGLISDSKVAKILEQLGIE